MTEILSSREDKIYIVVTQTGTILSRMLKAITRASYNHVSLTLDPTLTAIYSFGRKNPYNPFIGGFVLESPHFGTFRRFSETEAVVLEISVTEEQKRLIEERLAEMYTNRHDYTYNTLGLLLASLKICYQPERSYYCSEFVRDILKEFNVVSPTDLPSIPEPIQFLKLASVREIYRGKLRKFPHLQFN